MARARDLLRRFRPAGAPGAAAAAGVPADRINELAAELEPVLVRLAEAQQLAHDLRARGRTEADAITRDARERAGSLIAAARAVVEAERAAAAARLTELADSEAAAALASAERDAVIVRGRAAERMPAYVDRAVATARDMAGRPVL